MANFVNKIWNKMLNFLENNKIYKKREGAILSGVCSGLAARFGVEVNIIRVVWLIALIPTFMTALIVYIILSIMMPEKQPVSKFKNSEYIDGRAWKK